jgi:hypothetical protein
MGLAKLNIWVSDVADPCGTWSGGGTMTILDCDGILEWPCGQYLTPDGKWQIVPNGKYKDIPFRCGHLEVEVPPGCYWVVAGYVSPNRGYIHLNYTTHAGIVQVGCDETACVKIYNPTLRLCWDWFWVGLRVLAATGQARIDPARVEELGNFVEEFLRDAPHLPIERVLERVFDDLVESAKSQPKQEPTQ